MELKITKADDDDLLFIKELEKLCFPSFQQMPERSLKHCIYSASRDVMVAQLLENNEWKKVGVLILHNYKKTLRIYSIAVLPEYRKWRIGKRMMEHSLELARQKNYEKISLEVLASNYQLIEWYEQFGFKTIDHLADYYGDEIDAFRMKLQLKVSETKTIKENLIVLEGSHHNMITIENVTLVSAKDYISTHRYQKLKNARVFNLCNSYKYQGLGYYVSLLASARDHRVIPSVTTMSDYHNASLIKSLSYELDEIIQKSFKGITGTKLCLNIFFGQTEDPAYKQLAHGLYLLFETPLLQVHFTRNGKWNLGKITPLNLSKIGEEDKVLLEKSMVNFFSRKRFKIPRLKNYRYDLAVLVNPKEKNPPSSKKALERLAKVAEKKGIFTEFITKKDINRICEFDALFIRETTSVNNYTYHIARTAYAEGLVVLDDPWSILRCSNKIFLYERMLLNGIRMPYSKVLSKKGFKPSQVADMGYPMVLKQPDGSFSLGVSKVNNEKELIDSLNLLFKNSELIIVQEFLPSPYDWRIGILDNQPLFACKYYMAKGHWQIYNWKDEKDDVDGEFETMPLSEVPKKVLLTATKAASLMGDGLYGVDLKEVDGETFLIEVNDNPNIDYGIEDKVLKDGLYEKLLDSFVRRIELSKNISKYIAADPL